MLEKATNFSATNNLEIRVCNNLFFFNESGDRKRARSTTYNASDRPLPLNLSQECKFRSQSHLKRKDQKYCDTLTIYRSFCSQGLFRVKVNQKHLSNMVFNLSYEYTNAFKRCLMRWENQNDFGYHAYMWNSDGHIPRFKIFLGKTRCPSIHFFLKLNILKSFF